MTATRHRLLDDDTITVVGKTLYRLEAVCDIPEHGIVAGTRGGYVSKEAAFPQDSRAWIYPDARVIGGVFRGGYFHGGDFHGGDFRGGVFHGGNFHGGVFRGGVFRGGDWHSSPFQAQGLRHFINVADGEGNVQIGCHCKHIDEWLRCYEAVGKQEGYTETEIAIYKALLDACKIAIGETKGGETR